MPEENTIIPESLLKAIGVESDPITYEIEKAKTILTFQSESDIINKILTNESYI